MSLEFVLASHNAKKVREFQRIIGERDAPGVLRGAEFRCTIALVVPTTLLDGGHEYVAEGHWRGTLAYEPRGSNGFGYDPIFEPEGLEVTAAELQPAEKDARSHRARAFAELLPELERIAALLPA